jgi:NhaA family Na+:H+ antiporter
MRAAVTLLIGELASVQAASATNTSIGVLTSSLLGGAGDRCPAGRNRRYRRICAEEERDTDAEGVPDVDQADEARG